MRKILFINILSFALLLSAFSVKAQTTAITYQGKLNESSAAANGTYQMQFTLYDAVSGGTQIGTTLTFDGVGGNPPSVSVANGIFTVQLNFGSAAFTGADRFLEIRVKKPADANYTLLTPQQLITSAPYSIFSLNAMNANNALNLGGIAANQYLTVSGGGANFIQNTNTLQTGANFRIDGTGSADIFNVATEYRINDGRILSAAGTNNLFAGFG